MADVKCVHLGGWKSYQQCSRCGYLEVCSSVHEYPYDYNKIKRIKERREQEKEMLENE